MDYLIMQVHLYNEKHQTIILHLFPAEQSAWDASSRWICSRLQRIWCKNWMGNLHIDAGFIWTSRKQKAVRPEGEHVNCHAGTLFQNICLAGCASEIRTEQSANDDLVEFVPHPYPDQYFIINIERITLFRNTINWKPLWIIKKASWENWKTFLRKKSVIVMTVLPSSANFVYLRWSLPWNLGEVHPPKRGNFSKAPRRYPDSSHRTAESCPLFNSDRWTINATRNRL